MGENKLHEIRYLCEIITPMFLGDHTGRGAELRPPSIKGAMRFWWRATQSYTSIAALKTAEGNIFGTPEGEGKKSKVLITVKILDPAPPTNNPLAKHKFYTIINNKNIPIDIIEYLAYGKTESGKNDPAKYKRYADYFKPGSKFEVVILTPHEHIKTVNEVFHLVAKYGGLGGKSRNGFGSFRILPPEGASPFTVSANLYTGNYSELPDYPAFSTHTEEIHSGQTYNEWKDAMGALGEAYYNAKNDLGKTPSLPNSIVPNKKGYLGKIKPLNTNKKEPKLFESEIERIAKPYFFRIDKTADNKFKIRVLFLPSKFLEGFRNNQNNTLLDESQSEYLELLKKMTKTLSDNLKGGNN